jgi:hypothetical protein
MKSLAEPLWKIKKSLGRREFDISSQHTHSPRFFSKESIAGRCNLPLLAFTRNSIRLPPWLLHGGVTKEA